MYDLIFSEKMQIDAKVYLEEKRIKNIIFSSGTYQV